MKCKSVWQWNLSLPLERRGDQHRMNGRRQMTPWCFWSDFRVSCCFSEKLMNEFSENKTQQWNHSLASIEELPAQENHDTRAAVRGLEFNVLSPHLLASGGDDGDLYIWDISTPSSVSHYPSLRGGVQGELSYVSWNRKVHNILASTSFSGTSVVWDLRRQKPVISFTDPTSRRRCSALQWNPDVATQLIVASDDDRSPSLQVWDLRNSVSPLKELVGHTKGVLAMAWCPSDSSLLLSCAKDNRTLCWDTISGQVLCELPASGNWNFDVQWSPCTPGVLSTSSFDGQIGIYNIEACSRTRSNNSIFGGDLSAYDYSTALTKAPKWLKRPVGVSFGFGGKLVSFAPKKGAGAGGAPATSEVRIHSLITEEALVKRSTKFEEAIAGGERSSLRNFCESKASAAGSEEERETWSLLKIMFEEEARVQLLTHFGFSAKPTENGDASPLEDDTLVNEELLKLSLNDNNSPPSEDALLPTPPVISRLEERTLESPDDVEDFFDKLETPPTPTEANGPLLETPSTEEKEEAHVAEQEADVVEVPVTTTEAGEEAADSESEAAIQQALVAGDFKAAVDHCLAANRMADALVIAGVGGATLWESTQNIYIQRTQKPYLKVLSAVIKNDLQGLVDTRPLKAWKETLALICTYAQSEDWTKLCDALGARLDAGHEPHAATWCYICAGNVEKAVDIWARTLKVRKGSVDFVDLLQDVMEKSVVLGLASGTKQVSASLERLVCYYAELLASQGLLDTALEYLNLSPADNSSQEMQILRDRISQSSQAEKILEAPPPVKELQPESYSNLPSDNTQFSYPTPQPSPYYSHETYHQDSTQSPQYANPYQQSQVTPGVFTPTPTHSYYPTTHPPTLSNIGSPRQQQLAPPTTFVPQQSQPPTGFFPAPPTATPTFQPYVQQPPVGPPSSLYQTGGQQAYSGAAVPQPSVMMPGPSVSTMPPAPQPRGFVPVSTPSEQAPATQQPSSPQVASANTFAAPPAPAATVQTADTSNVAAELKPVVATLTRLFNETSDAVGGSRAPPAKKREIDDNSRKLGALFVKLNSADISPNASLKLGQLCQALNVGDYATALQIQVALTTSDWDECSFWLAALKRMIKTRQSLR
ncbi:hypothetical protein CY35_17G005100 [Sphagnum magellanicum]|nr:hypothetical protein CY35_17G005100 [Sphagnum magellanicum]KAH9534417.1 hypothetical protein CY35_17G005100 [Sphagnum magellanicum]KAH9534418.1 hypothetical protein CY35_17G005100 [Sphagnum magellanicum]